MSTSIKAAPYSQLIKAGIIPWIIRQRSRVGKHSTQATIINKSSWRVNPYGLEVTYMLNGEDIRAYMFGAAFVAKNDLGVFKEYEVRCYVNPNGDTLLSFEWDSELPEDVKPKLEPPPDYGTWS